VRAPWRAGAPEPLFFSANSKIVSTYGKKFHFQMYLPPFVMAFKSAFELHHRWDAAFFNTQINLRPTFLNPRRF
jgi:hypothetical protein